MFDYIKQPERGWVFTRIAALVTRWRYGPALASTLAVLLGVVALTPLPDHPVIATVLLFGCAGMTFVSAVVNDSLSKDVQQLRQAAGEDREAREKQETSLRAATANHRRLVKILLQVIANDLQFGQSERVNLYKPDQLRTPSGATQIFTRLGRYSANATFNSDGRSVYPANEGLLRRAWDEGFAYDECPHPPRNARGRKKYFGYLLSKFGIPHSTSAAFRMNPMSMVAIRLDRGTENVALVCLESTAQHRLRDNDRIRQAVAAHESLLLALVEHDAAFSVSSEEGL